MMVIDLDWIQEMNDNLNIMNEIFCACVSTFRIERRLHVGPEKRLISAEPPSVEV